MSMIAQIAILFLLCLIGQGIAGILPIPIPGSIIGMILLLILLLVRGIKIKSIEQVSNFLLQNMAFFFIPAGVSVMKNVELLKGKIGILLLICFLTTIMTFGATGLTVKAIITLQEKRRQKKNASTI